MSDITLTVRLSDEKLSRLRRKYPQLPDEEALLQVVDEGLATPPADEQDTEAVVARLRQDFPDDPLVQFIGVISVPVEESPAEHHNKYAYGD